MLLGESKLQPVAAAEAVDGEDSQLAGPPLLLINPVVKNTCSKCSV